MSATGSTGRGLRPDTFPFLAVLLCAMGSLILLLLVMDRRAKAVARAKALQVIARAAEEDTATKAARQAEWERRRAALRAALLQQDEEAREQLRQVWNQVAVALQEVQSEQARRRELETHVQAEQAVLVEGERGIHAAKERAGAADREAAGLRVERARLTAELEQVERTLDELKLLRQRQQQTYSVVPYRGKHGDNRRPLYLECTAAGLVFHPERKALEGVELTPMTIRAEVERRATAASGGKPYLLFLVRPDGIRTYYRAQAGLVGFAADFGYELIDADWALDFPADGGAAPSTAAATRPTAPAPRGLTQDRATASSVPLSHPTPAPPSGVGQAVSGVPSTSGSMQGSAGTASPGFGGSGSGGSLAQEGTPVVHGAISPPATRAPATAPAAGLAPPSILGGLPRSEGQAAASGGANAGGARERGESPPAGVRPPPRGLAPGDAAPARRSAARDWVIAVECRGDGFVLYPGATRIPLTQSAKVNAEHPLTQAVRQEIARRRARIPAEEASSRPHVRFLVRPDGGRAYYTAYPLLEGLGAAMSRQNLDAEEEIAVEHLTR